MPKIYSFAGFTVEEHDLLDSTNSYLKRRAEGCAGDLCAIARAQTGGRGRLGRSFYSPDGGLYMSALLHDLPEDFYRYITPAAAVAVAEALEACGSDPAGIKWVNDVYIGGRKVCGILAETVGAAPGAAIVGVGVNLFEPAGGFPDEIKNRAGAVFGQQSEGLRLSLAKKILENLRHEIPLRADLSQRYRARSILDGKRVEVLPTGGEAFHAQVLGVDDDFRLVVEAQGEIRKLFSGEVSVRETPRENNG